MEADVWGNARNKAPVAMGFYEGEVAARGMPWDRLRYLCLSACRAQPVAQSAGTPVPPVGAAPPDSGAQPGRGEGEAAGGGKAVFLQPCPLPSQCKTRGCWGCYFAVWSFFEMWN